MKWRTATGGHKLSTRGCQPPSAENICSPLGCHVSWGLICYRPRGRQGLISECLHGALGPHREPAPVQHLAPGDRNRCCVRTHHRRRSGGKRNSNENVSVGEVHADRAQLVPVQSGSGGPAAPGDLRPGGCQPLPGGPVAVRPRRLQTDPVHSAHLGGSLRVHTHGSLRGQVLLTQLISPSPCHRTVSFG